MSLYAILFLATNDGKCGFTASSFLEFLIARSEQEAKGLGYEKLDEHYPENEGWAERKILVKEVPVQKYLDAKKEEDNEYIL